MLRFKQYLAEADTSTATLTEMAICYQFNSMIINRDHETAMREAEIERKSFSKFEGLLETGKNMVEGLVKEDSGIAKQNKAVHYGGGSDGVTPFWSKYGAGAKAASRTPKTDLYIGKYNILSFKAEFDLFFAKNVSESSRMLDLEENTMYGAKIDLNIYKKISNPHFLSRQRM